MFKWDLYKTLRFGHDKKATFRGFIWWWITPTVCRIKGHVLTEYIYMDVQRGVRVRCSRCGKVST